MKIIPATIHTPAGPIPVDNVVLRYTERLPNEAICREEKLYHIINPYTNYHH
jgi:hypothetical protein